MSDRSSLQNDTIFQDFEAKLKECTVAAACGRPYILISEFTAWLERKARRWSGGQEINTSPANLLLDATYRTWNPAPPIDVYKLLKGSGRCLLVFSILLGMGVGNCIHKFTRKEKFDSDLPIDLYTLKQIFADTGLSEPNKRAEDFNAMQWRFCPASFKLDMDHDFWKDRVLPICNKQEINLTKGGTAKLWQITVLEEFVEEDLRKVVKNSRYDPKDYSESAQQDNLGPRYQFALKVFDGGNKLLYENETKAFHALRTHGGMVRYLGGYTHEETRSYSTTQRAVVAGNQEAESTTTYNILLEFGKSDLDDYFIDRNAPLLPKEIEAFWKGLFDVANAVERMHNLKTNSDGIVKEYRGWHADIKPDNILIIEEEDPDGKMQERFKLADPGFAKFVSKTSQDKEVRLDGGTETYGAPERHRWKRNSLSTQTIDTWSLGCVFSMAATWVVLGHEGIKQYNELRKKAILKIIDQQRLQTDLLDSEKLSRGDFFHDGTKILDDVLHWHALLRKTLRRTDSVTSLVLDLVDQKMLLGSPEKRATAKELCTKLKKISDEIPQDVQTEIPSSILQILLEVDEEAPAKVQSLLSETAPSRANALTTFQDRRDRKSRFLTAPLMKTPFRSEHFKSELAVRGSQSNASEVNARQDLPQQQESFPPRAGTQMPLEYIESRNPETPLRLQRPQLDFIGSRPIFSPRKTTKTGPPQNIWQAREEIEIRERGNILHRTRKDKLLDQHFEDRDIIFLVDNAESMRSDWYQATELLDTLVMKAKGQDENGMDLQFTIGKEGVSSSNSPSAFRNAMKAARPEIDKAMHTDILTRLGKIFENYLREAKRATKANTKVRSLTLIVLTNGLWEGTRNKNDVRQKIVTFVKDLTGVVGGLGSRSVSIEFVQFGDDPDVRHMLRSLDDDLIFDGIPDIIDTEHCLGDVNKMLLGSFVGIWDEIDDEAEDDPVTSPSMLSEHAETRFGPFPPSRSSTHHNPPSIDQGVSAEGLSQPSFDPRAPSRSRTEVTAGSQGLQRHPSDTSRNKLPARATLLH